MTIPLATMSHTALQSSLPQDHVLAVMMAEHDVILGFLDKMSQHRLALLSPSNDDTLDTLGAIAKLGEVLVSAENHHQREEQVLFPALEALGVSGPLQAMLQEHEWLRTAKNTVIALASATETMSIDAIIADLAPKVEYLTSLLISHISKENQVLYPLAYQLITDPAEWDALKQACDRIGYCPFTPAF